MRAIITGANGFIGKNLIKCLLSRNYDITALDFQFDEEVQSVADVKCVVVKDKTLQQIKEELSDSEYDIFFHLAWAGTSGPGRADYELQLNNVKLTCDYIKLASEINCDRFIYASSINEMETYEYLQSDGINPAGGYIYGTGKLAAHLMGETVAKLKGVDFIPVIITNIYGIGEKSARLIYTSISKLLKGEHCSFTEGYQTYDFIYITDAINSIVEVGEKGTPFNRYYIGSGKPKQLRDFLLCMRDIVAPNAEIGLGDIPFKGMDISYDQFDMRKVSRDTGYKNKITFEKGIKMTADWIKSMGGIDSI